MTPFDFINDISNNKKNLIVDKYTEKEYVPFMVNKGLSYFPDTIMYANQMNIYYHLDHKLQNDYLINIIRPRKRFSKWVKKEDNDDLNAIAEYYDYNMTRAEEALSLLSPEQIEEIKEKINKGGV